MRGGVLQCVLPEILESVYNFEERLVNVTVRNTIRPQCFIKETKSAKKRPWGGLVLTLNKMGFGVIDSNLFYCGE